jgi:molybdopterin-guanine dinucleotide biosynthesis protein
MFGRQMEKEQIIGFLLQPEPAQDFDVLPIIGPHEVGKRTLVEHACLDDRVRDHHFAKIHHLTSDDLDLQSHDHHGHHQG